MSNQIVTVAVTSQAASAPSNYQQKGCLVSQGGTTLAQGASVFLTQLSDLTSILAANATIASLSYASGTVTVTCDSTCGVTTGQQFGVVISGCTPLGYNGTFTATCTDTTTFTYPLASNPGVATVFGLASLLGEVELVAMATTWFAQGNSTGVYVLELGTTSSATAITNFSTYLTANPLNYYVYVTPSGWDTISAFTTLVNQYTSDTAQTYFFAPVSLDTYTIYKGIKSVFAWYLNSNVPNTEWDGAAMAWQVSSAKPSAASQVPPFSFRYLFGVIPAVLTSAQQSQLKAAYVNWVETAAEGGISNKMQVWGTAGDGNDFLYWYSVDWVQINANTVISATVINGSNTTNNPLYYNQAGINRLQAAAQSVMNSAISFGLALSPISVQATGFTAYVTANPTDYAAGIYNGLSVSYTPTTGFTQITFNVTVSNFPIGV